MLAIRLPLPIEDRVNGLADETGKLLEVLAW